MSNPSDILLLCDDLIFVSRVSGTARAHGLSLRSVKSPTDLLRVAAQAPPRCVILDLNTPGLDIAQTVRELAELKSDPLLVGYGLHVDVETLKKAREAGCDIVWPRSKFAEELETALPQWAVA
jgi:CheY-like chemotaxis protein